MKVLLKVKFDFFSYKVSLINYKRVYFVLIRLNNLEKTYQNLI